jgi:hypothetical protein
MKTKKYIIVGFIVFLIFITTLLTSCWKDNVDSKKQSLNFSDLINNENIDDISLTIYFINPFILTRHPWSAEEIIRSREEQKIVINGNDLEEHIDLFKQINNDDLIPVKKKSYLDARLYYVFESKKNGKLFDVAMWGSDNSIFVNGFEVKENEIFYDVIKPFLPIDAVKELEDYLEGT